MRLTLVDAYTRKCLAIDVERRLGSEDVLERLKARIGSTAGARSAPLESRKKSGTGKPPATRPAHS